MMRSRLSLKRLVTAIVLIAVFAAAVRIPASPDTWWHLRCGEIQWRTRSVIKSDLFSHTAQGTRWVNQSWLPQLAMYGLWLWGGFPALALAVAAIVAVTMGLVLVASEAQGRFGYLWRAFVIIWTTVSTGRVWAARPHLLSFLLTAVWIYLLDTHRSGQEKARWWLPPLMLLWANSHGGYIMGLLMLAAEIGSIILDALRESRTKQMWKRARPLLVTMLLSLVAAMINPQGIRLIVFPFQTLSSFAQQSYVAEWASPDFHAVDMLPFLALLLATWSVIALSSKPVESGEWLRLLGFTAMALRSGRYLGLCAVVMAPLLAKYGASALTRFVPRARAKLASWHLVRGQPVFSWSMLILVTVGALVKISQPLDSQLITQIHQQSFPVAAVDYMRDHELPPTLFNEYAWGGYLIWRLYPEYLVFIDGRADPYGDALIASYREIMSAQPEWQTTLDEHQVHTALLPADSRLALDMEASERWRLAYKDDVAVIFIKQ